LYSAFPTEPSVNDRRQGDRALQDTNPCYTLDVRPKRETKTMSDITYDAEADAVYITVGHGKIDHTEEAGPFIYDVDAEGHIVGIEILSASKELATGDWKKAGLQGAG
jgi:uncharacterized protein YuzE